MHPTPSVHDRRAMHVLVTALLVYALLSSPNTPRWAWLVLGPAFLGWLVFLALTRRAPRVALAALAACSLLASAIVGVPEASATTIAAVALMVFISHPVPSLGLGFALTAADITLVTVSGLLWERGTGALLSNLGIFALLTLLGLVQRQHRQQNAQAARLLAETERTRIARELHDVLAHSLGALAVQLEVAEALLSEGRDPEGALARVRRSRRLAVDGLTEARAAVAALRSDVPPLPAALAELTQAHQRDHQSEVRLRTDGGTRALSPAAEVSLLRTAREALTNAAKHAAGAPIEVDLSYVDGAVRLSVRNAAGTARTELPGGGFGLTGMRERLALLGGTLTAGPDGDGWLVRAEVPE
ncbi:sensor histidine kinase [Crossiella cryophila]|uniref:histidine kinase n=1 Tax=Crossiella cryophila TaxID=43355 RepID=A0A7W7CAU6_9PSEU|nr:histidine kinase [Crossiella cryophila]MBB4676486.1 signal transduction histidine kinase [Crossiella cryophila]